MSLTTYEKFLGYDWVRYSGLASRGTCLGTAVIGIAAVILAYSILLGLLSIFIALVLALWEFPWIFHCIPKFDQAMTFLNEKAHIQNEEVKAAICIVLSILTYLSPSFVILSGILLDITAVLFIFAGINKRQDRQDGMIPDEESPYEQQQKRQTPPSMPTTASMSTSLLQASGRFGTF